jgi:CDP-4-dehydro-6-deoxyglucose reductase
LERLIASGVPMPNSCRRGSCQQCGCRIQFGEFSDRRDVKDGISDNFHLACQIDPQSDLKIELYENPYETLEKPQYIPAKVVRIERLSEKVIGLGLVLPRNQVFKFRPGQYANVKPKSNIVRSYSIAAFDPASRILDFHIRLIDGGQFSKWLVAAAPDELLQIHAPIGRFYLRESIAVRKTVMVATGTGITPIFCMLARATDEQRSRLGQISIVWGNRNKSDNYLDGPLSTLVRVIGAGYRAVYSAESDVPFKGRVTDWMPTSLENTQVFAAGHPQMIADLRTLAHARGLPHTLFHSDAFAFASSLTEQS